MLCEATLRHLPQYWEGFGTVWLCTARSRESRQNTSGCSWTSRHNSHPGHVFYMLRHGPGSGAWAGLRANLPGPETRATPASRESQKDRCDWHKVGTRSKWQNCALEARWCFRGSGAEGGRGLLTQVTPLAQPSPLAQPGGSQALSAVQAVALYEEAR